MVDNSVLDEIDRRNQAMRAIAMNRVTTSKDNEMALSFGVDTDTYVKNKQHFDGIAQREQANRILNDNVDMVDYLDKHNLTDLVGHNNVGEIANGFKTMKDAGMLQQVTQISNNLDEYINNAHANNTLPSPDKIKEFHSMINDIKSNMSSDEDSIARKYVAPILIDTYETIKEHPMAVLGGVVAGAVASPIIAPMLAGLTESGVFGSLASRFVMGAVSPSAMGLNAGFYAHDRETMLGQMYLQNIANGFDPKQAMERAVTVTPTEVNKNLLVNMVSGGFAGSSKTAKQVAVNYTSAGLIGAGGEVIAQKIEDEQLGDESNDSVLFERALQGLTGAIAGVGIFHGADLMATGLHWSGTKILGRAMQRINEKKVMKETSDSIQDQAELYISNDADPALYKTVFGDNINMHVDVNALSESENQSALVRFTKEHGVLMGNGKNADKRPMYKIDNQKLLELVNSKNMKKLMLNRKATSFVDMSKVEKNERASINEMQDATKQINSYRDMIQPIKEMSEEFFKRMNKGQSSGSLITRKQVNDHMAVVGNHALYLRDITGLTTEEYLQKYGVSYEHDATVSAGEFSTAIDKNADEKQQFTKAGKYIPEDKKIVIFKGANLSALVHEIGHYQLDVNTQVYATLKGKESLSESQQAFVYNMDELYKHLEIENVEEFVKDNTSFVDIHERFAEKMESHFAQGQARDNNKALQTAITNMTSALSTYDINKKLLNEKLGFGSAGETLNRTLGLRNDIENYFKQNGIGDWIDSNQIRPMLRKAGLSSQEVESFINASKADKRTFIEHVENKTLQDIKTNIKDMLKSKDPRLEKIKKDIQEIKDERKTDDTYIALNLLRGRAEFNSENQIVYKVGGKGNRPSYESVKNYIESEQGQQAGFTLNDLQEMVSNQFVYKEDYVNKKDKNFKGHNLVDSYKQTTDADGKPYFANINTMLDSMKKYEPDNIYVDRKLREINPSYTIMYAVTETMLEKPQAKLTNNLSELVNGSPISKRLIENTAIKNVESKSHIIIADNSYSKQLVNELKELRMESYEAIQRGDLQTFINTEIQKLIKLHELGEVAKQKEMITKADKLVASGKKNLGNKRDSSTSIYAGIDDQLRNIFKYVARPFDPKSQKLKNEIAGLQENVNNPDSELNDMVKFSIDFKTLEVEPVFDENNMPIIADSDSNFHPAFTVEQVHAIHETMKSMFHASGVLLKDKEQGKINQFESINQQGIEEMEKGGKTLPADKLSTDKDGFKRKVLRYMSNQFDNLPTVFAHLTGLKDSIYHRVIDQGLTYANVGQANSLKWCQKTIKQPLKEVMDSVGNLFDTTNREQFTDLHSLHDNFEKKLFTKNEIYNLVAHVGTEEGYQRLTHQYSRALKQYERKLANDKGIEYIPDEDHITERVEMAIQKVVDSLSEKEFELLRTSFKIHEENRKHNTAMRIEEYGTKPDEALRRSIVQSNGKNAIMDGGYIPLIYKDSGKSTSNNFDVNANPMEMVMATSGNPTTLNTSHIKTRQEELTTDFELDLNFMKNTIMSWSAVTKDTHFTPVIRKFNYILASQDFKRTMQSLHGHEFAEDRIKILKDFRNEITVGSAVGGHGFITSLVTYDNIFTLAGSVSTTALQAFGLVPVLIKNPVIGIESMIETFSPSSFKKSYQESEILQHRFENDAVLSDLYNSFALDMPDWIKVGDKYLKSTLRPITYMQTFVDTVTYKAGQKIYKKNHPVNVYSNEYIEKMNRYAEEYVTRYQTSNMRHHKGMFYKTPLGRVFAQFSNYWQALYNLMKQENLDMRNENVARRWAKMIGMTMAYIILPSFLPDLTRQIVGGYKLEDYEEDPAMAVRLGIAPIFSLIPFAKTFAQIGDTNTRLGMSNPLRGVERVTGSLNLIHKQFMTDNEMTTSDFSSKLAKLLLPTGGVVGYELLKRMVEDIDKGKDVDVLEYSSILLNKKANIKE